MENKNISNIQADSSSKIPYVIIGVVLLAAILGGLWLMGGKEKSAANSNSAGNSAKQTTIPANAPEGARPPWALGPTTAQVTVEEFADFQCPSCAAMHPKVKELRSTFGDRVRLIFREFPLQMHPFGYDAACAAEAAGLQGKFWDMQNLLFTNQQTWANSPNPRQMFKDYAKTLGLNPDKFEDDMLGLETKNRVDADVQRGKALPVTSTPSFYINGKALGSNLDGLKAKIEEELKNIDSAKQPANSNSSTTNSNTASNK